MEINNKFVVDVNKLGYRHILITLHCNFSFDKIMGNTTSKNSPFLAHRKICYKNCHDSRKEVKNEDCYIMLAGFDRYDKILYGVKIFARAKKLKLFKYTPSIEYFKNFGKWKFTDKFNADCKMFNDYTEMAVVIYTGPHLKILVIQVETDESQMYKVDCSKLEYTKQTDWRLLSLTNFGLILMKKFYTDRKYYGAMHFYKVILNNNSNTATLECMLTDKCYWYPDAIFAYKNEVCFVSCSSVSFFNPATREKRYVNMGFELCKCVFYGTNYFACVEEEIYCLFSFPSCNPHVIKFDQNFVFKQKYEPRLSQLKVLNGYRKGQYFNQMFVSKEEIVFAITSAKKQHIETVNINVLSLKTLAIKKVVKIFDVCCETKAGALGIPSNLIRTYFEPSWEVTHF